MKKLFLLMSCLLMLGASPVWAVVEDPQIVVVRIKEAGTRVTVYTARGNETPEEEEVSIAGSYNRAVGKTTVIYQQTIAKLYQQGYVLQSTMTFSSGSSNPDSATMIFVKAPKP